jgi:acetoin utilization deacetylase AcuC-like enzyme
MSPKLQGSLAPEQLNLRDRVQEGDAPGAQVLLEAAPAAAKKEWANTVDEQGFTLLMEAVALENLENSAETMRVLLHNGANASVADEDGYTALHWAAACDNEVAVSILVAEARVDVDCRCSARFGTETALHRGARMGNVDAVQALLEHGADLGARGAFNQTADEIAGDYDGRITLKHRAAIRKCLFTFQPRLRTLVLQHPDCLLHVTEDTHQEAPARIHAILRKLGQAKFFPPYEINVTDEFKAATDKAVGRAHTAEYLAFLRQLTAQVRTASFSCSFRYPFTQQDGAMVQLAFGIKTDAVCVVTTPCTNQVIAHPDRPAVPFTPKVQKLMQLQSDEEIKDADKSDTTFSAGSLQAALRAAGSVIAAIDAVVDGTHRNAFCCVRPPGHHAGANGLESDAVSCGFCIFNNVAIGALHALRERSSVVKKVAVIDFDVHHGNGTQAIFEGIDDPSAVFFFSIHLCEFAGLPLHHCSTIYSRWHAQSCLRNILADCARLVAFCHR